MVDKKNFNKFLLILGLIIITVFSAGCTSDSSTSDNNIKNNDSNYNYSSSNGFNNLNNSSENLNANSNDKPTHYEKKGYCDYVVDGDTIDVEGVGQNSLCWSKYS